MLREGDDSRISSDAGNDLTRATATVNETVPLPSFRASIDQQSGSNGSFSAGCRTMGHATRHVDTNNGATAVEPAGRLSAGHWRHLETGLQQRFEATNACLNAVIRKYSLPAFLKSSPFLTRRIEAMLAPIGRPPNSDPSWTWFGSTDLHFAADGQLTVLDHNFSGATGLDTLAELINAGGKSETPAAERMARILFQGGSCARDRSEPGSSDVAVLDPGYCSATFGANEFLARCLNAHVARSSDLSVRSDGVFLRAGRQLVRLSTIVRRIDDDLLDPNCFRPDSLVGVPGLVRVWKHGLVNVVSPPGTCVANDRSFGMLIPRMIREFLGQSPLLSSAEVLECSDPVVLRTVLKSCEHFAIRTNDPQHPARPYFGGSGSTMEFAEMQNRLIRNPTAFVARPLLPSLENAGLNLRIFASCDAGFRLLRAALARPCQPDGGASQTVDSSGAVSVIL